MPINTGKTAVKEFNGNGACSLLRRNTKIIFRGKGGETINALRNESSQWCESGVLLLGTYVEAFRGHGLHAPAQSGRGSSGFSKKCVISPHFQERHNSAFIACIFVATAEGILNRKLWFQLSFDV